MFSEISLMAWMSGVIVFAIGGGAGFFIARQIKDKHTLGLEKQLETTQSQLSEYQGEVNRHFLKTSLLFNKLTDNYREVYEHLATGAQKLCNDKPLPTALDLPETKILTAAVATGASAAIADEISPEVDTATLAPEDTGHNNPAHPGDETIAASEETITDTKTVSAEDTELPEKTMMEQTSAGPATTDSVVTEKVSAAETLKVAETADDIPTLTEEESKTLEANEQKKDDEENILLGAESTPGVELERHKTHPSIH